VNIVEVNDTSCWYAIRFWVEFKLGYQTALRTAEGGYCHGPNPICDRVAGEH